MEEGNIILTACPIDACPFCGNTAHFLIETEEKEDSEDQWGRPVYKTQIRCGHCGAVGPQDISEVDAIVKWNTRKRPNKMQKCIISIEAEEETT